MSPARLEAFSDGVLAIAATLLVLELQVPSDTDNLARALVAMWPSYVAYLTSFATIGIIWVNHHELIANVRRVDRQLMFLNLLLLMIVSVIPFPTALLGRYVTAGDGSHIAAAVYGGVMLLMSIAFTLLWRHVNQHHRDTALDPGRTRREGRLFSIGLLPYAVAIALSFVSAPLALAIYAGTAIFYLFPWLPEAPPRDASEAGSST
jgi:uncharacterized membrane protein